MLNADIYVRFRCGVKFFCILLSVCISCHPYIVWSSCSLSSCARCLCFLPVSFVLLDVSAGSSSCPPVHHSCPLCSRPPFCPLSLFEHFLSCPLFFTSISFLPYPLLSLLSPLLSLLSLPQSIVFSYLLFSRPSLCLASGQHQLHGVDRADRHQRTG